MATARITLASILILLLTHCTTKERGLTMPAEWERQEAILITYTEDPDDSLTSVAVRTACDDLIDVVADRMKVYVLIADYWNADSLKRSFSSRGYSTGNIELVKVKQLFSMGVARDYGPLVVKDGNGLRRLMKFNWDYVGADMLNPDTSWTNWKNNVRGIYFRQMSERLSMPVVESLLTIEGGEIELNGQGTALLVESFTKPRHPKMTGATFDSLLKTALGVSNIIWLKEGVAEDPSSMQSYAITRNIYGFGVGGHVDEFARFANANTILLAFPDSAEALVDPVKKINYDRMSVNYNILSKATDANGEAFEIV